MLTEITRGLETALAAGVIHRDLKPENVLLDTQGKARIADFGLGFLQADLTQDLLASGSLRKGTDLMISTFAELTTTLTGVELNVEGEEHLWSHRPAVFIFNHQSGLDPILMARLTQRDVVGVAKKELENAPILGALMKAAGVVFVDRGDRTKAIEAMRPAVEAIREGLSVVIAPEGTRSATKQLGKFKKGAFRMAMAADVVVRPARRSHVLRRRATGCFKDVSRMC